MLRKNAVAVTAQQMAIVPELGLGPAGIDQLRAHLRKPGNRGHPAADCTQPRPQQHRYARIRQALHGAPVNGIQVLGRTTRGRQVSAGLRVHSPIKSTIGKIVALIQPVCRLVRLEHLPMARAASFMRCIRIV